MRQPALAAAALLLLATPVLGQASSPPLKLEVKVAHA